MQDCSDLKTGQTCNLTGHFLDVFDYYRARVRAFVSNQTSKWTVSREFQPLSDSETPQHCYRTLGGVKGQREMLSHSFWIRSGLFVSAAVLGPPDVSVSGCGNCLVLQVRIPTEDWIQQNSQLKGLFWDLAVHIWRTRDGAHVSSISSAHLFWFPSSFFSVARCLKYQEVKTKHRAARCSHPSLMSAFKEPTKLRRRNERQVADRMLTTDHKMS